ncbi:hypothetical protein VUR80DRAFT_9603 [Thermomyces stellatus]
MDACPIHCTWDTRSMHSLVRSLLRGQTHMLIKPCGVIAAHALNTRHDLIFFRENCPLGQKLNRVFFG